ncbi:hypothetical protein GTQ40_06140 [Flavobacteriaceae bacterium R38]|nr:hypothetical protein [Flavobacteriaceae bacterium R38]
MISELRPISSTEYFIAFLICLISFLIGYFFARTYYKKKYKKQVLDLEERVNMFNAPIDTGEGIKAIKTRERMGEVVDPPLFKGIKSVKKETKPYLNFGSIGVADESQKDDLKKISGIGPFIEKKLNEIGIYTYKQISRFSNEDIDSVTKLIEFFPGRIKRDNWKKQAADLQKVNYPE